MSNNDDPLLKLLGGEQADHPPSTPSTPRPFNWFEENQYAEQLREEGISERLIKIVTTIPSSKRQLRAFFEEALGYQFKGGGILMAECVIDKRELENEHTVPMDWLWEIWCITNARSLTWKELTPKEVHHAKKEFLLHGPRGGMKTLALAGLWFCMCWFVGGYSVTHSATEGQQAAACLRYMRMWHDKPLFKNGVERPNAKGMTFLNNSRMALKTASMDGLKSEHTLSISIDEVETMEPGLLSQAMQIQQEEIGYHLPAIVILGSTQMQPRLGMAQLITAAKKEGKYKYFKWSCWDVGEHCDDWRREDVEKRGFTCADWSEINEEIARLEGQESLLAGQQGKLNLLLEQRDALKENCPLVHDCRGILVNGTGHLTINTLITRIRKISRHMWEAENLCTTPSRENSVYEKLDEQNLSEDAIYRSGMRVIAGVDYGFVNDMTAVVFMGMNLPFVDVFDEWAGNNMFEEDLIQIFIPLHKKYRVWRWVVPPDAAVLMRKMIEAGFPVARASRQAVVKGVDREARLICDGTNLRRLRFHPVTARETYEQHVAYAKTKSGKPEDGPGIDRCDAARVACEQVRIRPTPGSMQRRRRPGRSLGMNALPRISDSTTIVVR